MGSTLSLRTPVKPDFSTTCGQFHQCFTRVFHTKVVFRQLFSSFKPKTQLCNLCAKILYEKCARKMLMKLTPLINCHYFWVPNGGRCSQICFSKIFLHINESLVFGSEKNILSNGHPHGHVVGGFQY